MRLKNFAAVLILFWGFAVALFTGCAPFPAAPQPVMPVDGGAIHILSVRLEWQSFPGAKTYGLQVSANPAFTSLVAEQTGIAATYYWLTSGLKWNTSYYWRINASHAIGTSSWSESWQFTTSVLQLDKIAFSSNRDGAWDIYVMNADGSKETKITKDITGKFQSILDDLSISWSPDGTKIVFDSKDRGTFDIYTADSDGNNVLMLTTNPAHDCFPAWSPSSSQIAFASNRDQNWEIYVMNSDGTEKARLTNNAESDLFPCWSPDSTRIAFTSSRDGNDEIYVMNSDGSSQQRLTNNTAADDTPKWSPDGKKLVFTSNRDGNFKIYAMDTDGRNQTKLTNNTADDRWPVWR